MAGATRPESRWEFRAWFLLADAPGNAFDGFEATGADREERRDTYLLPAHLPGVIPKIRNGRRLEVKQLAETDDRGLERWEVLASAPFPIDGETLGIAAGLMAESEPGKEPDGTSPAAFLASVEAIGAAVVADVDKRRERFDKPPLMGEVTRVLLPAHDTEAVTVALESPDREALARHISAGPLAGLPNRNYGSFLRALVLEGRLETVRGDGGA